MLVLALARASASASREPPQKEENRRLCRLEAFREGGRDEGEGGGDMGAGRKSEAAMGATETMFVGEDGEERGEDDDGVLSWRAVLVGEEVVPVGAAGAVMRGMPVGCSVGFSVAQVPEIAPVLAGVASLASLASLAGALAVEPPLVLLVRPWRCCWCARPDTASELPVDATWAGMCSTCDALPVEASLGVAGRGPSTKQSSSGQRSATFRRASSGIVGEAALLPLLWLLIAAVLLPLPE